MVPYMEAIAQALTKDNYSGVVSLENFFVPDGGRWKKVTASRSSGSRGYSGRAAMKTAVITMKHRVEILDAPVPSLQDHEVLVKVEYAGICGSDIHLFHDEHPFRKPPMIPGHEMSGVVAEVGASVTKYKPGDRVVVNHAIPCGKCRFA